MRLDDHAADVHSQFGEDGCIAHIFKTIGVRSRLCVDFGAGDGLSCSNTASLWRDQGWKAVLVEPDAGRFDDLEGNASPFDTIRRRDFVTPSGPSSIAAILAAERLPDVDFMSIDVDGPDYHILRDLACRPRVICIEFNPTVPPHISAHQPDVEGTFGASLLALIQLAGTLEYTFVGATYCNAFFVVAEEATPFAEYETDPGQLFDPGQYTYVATDFAGRVVHLGQVLPWAPTVPYVRPVEASVYVQPPTNDALLIRRGFESVWGPARLLAPSGLTPSHLVAILDAAPPIVCVDLTSADPELAAWIIDEATRHSYEPLLVGRVLGLIHKEPHD